MIWVEIAKLALQSPFLCFLRVPKRAGVLCDSPTLCIPQERKRSQPSPPIISFALILLSFDFFFFFLSSLYSVFSQAWKGALALPTAGSQLYVHVDTCG